MIFCVGQGSNENQANEKRINFSKQLHLTLARNFQDFFDEENSNRKNRKINKLK